MTARISALTGVALALLLLHPASALARAVEREPAPQAPPEIHFVGGTIEERSLSIRCTREGDGLSCAIVIDFDAIAAEGRAAGQLELLGFSSNEVTLDPERWDSRPVEPNAEPNAEPNVELNEEPLAEDLRHEDLRHEDLRYEDPRYEGQARIATAVPPGQRVHVRIALWRTLGRGHIVDGYILMGDPLWMRHLLLSERSLRMSPDLAPLAAVTLPLFAPERATTRGPLYVTTEIPESFEATVDGASIRGSAVVEGGSTLSILPPPVDEEQILRHGGPFLALGAIETTTHVRFLARLGYEIGIHDWGILSAAFETDFETRGSVSLLAELATPAVFALILGFPGVSAGVGGVLDFSEQGVRAAVRMSAGAQLMPAGFTGTFDYYPDNDEWVFTLAGRLSL